MKKKLQIFLTVLLLTGLSAIAAAAVIRTRESSQSPIYMIYITKSSVSSNDFWESVKKGATTSAKENNIKLDVWSPKDETAIEEQNRLILKAIDASPNALVVTPSSATESAPALQKVKEAGIPIVYVDSVTDEPLADAIVQTDNVEAGRKMAKHLLPELTENDRIGIVAHIKESSTAQDRQKGFREGLGSYSSLIQTVIYGNSDVTYSDEVTKKMLQDYPDITCIACLNEDSSVGAGRAIKELGLSGKIRVIGFDNATEEIEDLEDGTFEALVVQKTFTMGYLGISKAAGILRGETVDYQTDSGSALITKETMYSEENQELLFPFYGQDEDTTKQQ